MEPITIKKVRLEPDVWYRVDYLIGKKWYAFEYRASEAEIDLVTLIWRCHGGKGGKLYAALIKERDYISEDEWALERVKRLKV